MNYVEVMNCIVIYGGRNDTLLEKYLNIKDNFLSDLWLLIMESLTWCRINLIGEVPSANHLLIGLIRSHRNI